MLEVISSYSSPRRNAAGGARFTTTTSGVDGRERSRLDGPREQPRDADRAGVAHRDEHVGLPRERLRRREPAARRPAEVLQRSDAVDDDDLDARRRADR